MNATYDLQSFVLSAIRGICDDQDKVHVEASTEGKNVILMIHCDTHDLRFVYSKMKFIKPIAIAIAQRNRSLVTIGVAGDTI